jgi:2-aminoadipate transaminase
VDQDVAKTLGELERKLLELEQTLTAIGQSDEDGPAGTHDQRAAIAAGSQNDRPGSVRQETGWVRLVDEKVERQGVASAGEAEVAAGYSISPSLASSTPPATHVAVPPPPAPTGGSPPATQPSGDPAMTQHAASPIAQSATPPTARPAAPGAGGRPSTSELLRFRERLERTAQELAHDYDELLSRLSFAAVPPPSGPSISFARGAPSLDIIDVDGLRNAAVRAFESDPGGSTAYGTAVGYPRLRAWIADLHGVEPERVLVTNGSLQADAFLFEHLVRAGDEVIVEAPTYDRTLLSLRERGARLHAIPLQPDGIDTDALARLLGGGGGARPRLAHIIPNFQNPAGYTLSMAKRQALLELAATYGFVLFEDDPYVALRFSGESLPTMLSMDPDRVVYASSFSKTICPGIRVGYLVGPPELIEAVAQLATNTYISPDMVAQSIVYEFCASGAIDRSIETVKAALAERARALGNALRRELPEAEFVDPEGGYFMWVTLPPGTDVHALHNAALERGVAFVKGSDFLLEGGENTLRLAYSGVTPDQIDEGVSRLAAAYRSLF